MVCYASPELSLSSYEYEKPQENGQALIKIAYNEVQTLIDACKGEMKSDMKEYGIRINK